jgi:hypothetical protein
MLIGVQKVNTIMASLFASLGVAFLIAGLAGGPVDALILGAYETLSVPLIAVDCALGAVIMAKMAFNATRDWRRGNERENDLATFVASGFGIAVNMVLILLGAAVTRLASALRKLRAPKVEVPEGGGVRASGDEGPPTVKDPNAGKGELDAKGLPKVPVGDDFRFKSALEAQQKFEELRTRSPDREAGWAYNSKTGEYVVLQGDQIEVDFRKFKPEDGWEFLEHNHPPTGEEALTSELNRIASTKDMESMAAEAAKRADGFKEETIRITTEAGEDVVSFGVDNNLPEKFFVDYPQPHSQVRVTARFKDLASYRRFVTLAKAGDHVDPKFADSFSIGPGHPGPSAVRNPGQVTPG